MRCRYWKMPGDLHADPGGPVFCRKMREFEEYLEAVGNGAVMEKIQKIHVPMVTGGRRMEHFPQELLWGDMGDFVRSLLKGQRNLWDS